jgi:hypothetical protein
MAVQHAKAIASTVRRMLSKRHRGSARNPFQVVHVPAEATCAVDLLERDDVGSRVTNDVRDGIQIPGNAPLRQERDRDGPPGRMRHVQRQET